MLKPLPVQKLGDRVALTLREIARLAGVSSSTASRVLNGQPGVRPEVRERVLQLIHESGYRPDPVARSLASRRSIPETDYSPRDADGGAKVEE